MIQYKKKGNKQSPKIRTLFDPIIVQEGNDDCTDDQGRLRCNKPPHVNIIAGPDLRRESKAKKKIANDKFAEM